MITFYDRLLDELGQTADGTFEVVENTVWIAGSDTDPSTMYWVVKIPLKPGIKFNPEDFTWTCSCDSYRYRSDCKHIERVQASG